MDRAKEAASDAAERTKQAAHDVSAKAGEMVSRRGAPRRARATPGGWVRLRARDRMPPPRGRPARQAAAPRPPRALLDPKIRDASGFERVGAHPARPRAAAARGAAVRLPPMLFRPPRPRHPPALGWARDQGRPVDDPTPPHTPQAHNVKEAVVGVAGDAHTAAEDAAERLKKSAQHGTAQVGSMMSEAQHRTEAEAEKAKREMRRELE